MSDCTHWHVGMRVVCVDDGDGHKYMRPRYVLAPDASLDGLTKGRIYTIRKVGPDYYDGDIVVWLKEIIRPPRGSIGAKYGECGYAPARFRPVQERKTSIEIFQRMLTPKRETERA